MSEITINPTLMYGHANLQFLARSYYFRCSSLGFTVYSLNCHREIAILRSSSHEMNTAQTDRRLSAGPLCLRKSLLHFSVSAVSKTCQELVIMRKVSLLAVSNVHFPRTKSCLLAGLCGALVASLAIPATMAQATTVNFGSVNVGATGTPVPITLAFNNGATIGSTAVLTQGAPGLDFSDAGSGTCAVGMAYAAGQSCTVNVGFSPKFAGVRYGAVVLYDTSGNVLATGFVQGTGIGPQINFLPGTETTIISSGLSYPSGIAVDGSGNLYIVDTGNARLIKATPGSGGYTVSTIDSGLSHAGAFGVAVDSVGNVYVGDSGNGRVLKETAGPDGYAQTTIASGLSPMGLAVDSSGNVFVADQLNDRILELTPSTGGYTQTTAVTGTPNV